MLVVVLHPRCSCSRATLSELETAAATFHHPYRAILLVYRPRHAGTGWQTAGLYSDVQKTLHARVIIDTDGALAARFGAQTSGQVYLYSGAARPSDRRLLFAGGVTAARGEVGDNRGLASLSSAFEQAFARPTDGRNASLVNSLAVQSPVYGCGLFRQAAFNKRGRP